MVLRVNPNRMELLGLKKRLALAMRGHKLLQDKLEEMMRRFLILLKDAEGAKEEFKKRSQYMLRCLVYCRMASSKGDFEETIAGIGPNIRLGVSTTKIMNLRVPSFNINEINIGKGYDFFKTSAQMDIVVAEARGYLESLLKLAQLVKALDILSYEIERTRRRVNALEYILIPSIKDTIRYITQKLNEFERGNLVRLMRIKDIVRAH